MPGAFSRCPRCTSPSTVYSYTILGTISGPDSPGRMRLGSEVTIFASVSIHRLVLSVATRRVTITARRIRHSPPANNRIKFPSSDIPVFSHPSRGVVRSKVKRNPPNVDKRQLGYRERLFRNNRPCFRINIGAGFLRVPRHSAGNDTISEITLK